VRDEYKERFSLPRLNGKENGEDELWEQFSGLIIYDLISRQVVSLLFTIFPV
jgi:hypothetical protein